MIEDYLLYLKHEKKKAQNSCGSVLSGIRFNENLNAIRRLMGVSASLEREIASLEEMMLQLTGTDMTTCPCCSKGKMQFFAEIPKGRARSPSHLTYDNTLGG